MAKSFNWRLLAVLGGLLILPQVAAAQPVDKTRLLTQSRTAYYSLTQARFAGATCRVVPDWPYALGKPRSDPDLQTAFVLLEKLQFTLAVDAKGATKVGRTDSTVGPNAQAEGGIQQILGGLREAMEGFFATWQLFMIDRPLPEPTETVAITEQDGGYHLAYKDGDTEVATDMSRAGVVSRIAVHSSKFESVVQPRFTHEAAGLVLTGYIGDYAPVSGPGKTHIDVAIDYRTDRGMKVPSLLTVDNVYDGAASRMRLALTECRIDQN